MDLNIKKNRVLFFKGFIHDNFIRSNAKKDHLKFKTIKVAILAEEPMGWDSGKHYFPITANGYSWTVGDISYKFFTSHIYV